MATDLKILNADANGAFSIEKLSRADIQRIDIADVDLIVTTKTGERYLLPKAGIDAMGEHPPALKLSDAQISVDQLMSQVGIVTDLKVNDTALTSQQAPDLQKEIEKKENDEKHLKDELAKIQKELQVKEAEIEKKVQEEKEHQQQHDKKADVSSLTNNTESSVEKLVLEAKKIEENMHRSDKDFSEPTHFSPPPAAFSAAPGVPAPISLTPLVTISMGNVVGTTTSGSYIYGGGGAAGSESDQYIGPRNPLQFSAATITGTSGADIIYTNGPLVGNLDPTTSRVNNAKEIIINVAGYFTRLNDIVISGVPSGVSFVGATDNGDGTWTLPSATVAANLPITLVYDMDAWRSSGSNSFDLEFKVSGQSTRGVTFETIQSFRFLYMDVTDVNQITDPTLIYDSRGQIKQIYILPTMDQPNIINSGDGNDIIYAGRNNDTITAGNGDDNIYAGAGDDTVIVGNGTNYIDLNSGNNTLTSGTGNDTVVATDGNNIINVSAGTNSITLGNGNNQITALGGNDTLVAGNGRNVVNLGDGNNNITLGNGINSIITGTGDDIIVNGSGAVTINAGAGNNTITTNGGLVNITAAGGDDHINVNGGGGTIAAGAGANIISVTTGNYTITTGSGNDIITAGNGNNIINAGDGVNNVTVGNGNNTITSGSGNDTLIGGTGTNVFSAGLGTNTITGNSAGNNTVDYSLITTTAIVASLLSQSVTGTSLADTLSNIQNITGTGLADTITGNANANVIHGGAGNDIITGGGGNDTLYGDDGDDIITGGAGNDTIYGGSGNNTIYTGISGIDVVHGGSGNNIFISQHAGVVYDGTNGANLIALQQNKIDYSADTVGMNINLQSGAGTGGLADGDLYQATPTLGYNSINWIIGGTGSDTLTGSLSDDRLEGGAGNDSLTGGGGNNVLIGGTGDNNYYMGLGNDTIIGSTGGTDRLRYNLSGAGVVINLDSVSHSFVNSAGATITIAAYSGGNKGVTAADANSYSNGDYYTPVSGTNTSIDEIYGSNLASAGDVIYGGSGTLNYYNGAGNDYFYGGSGAELVSYSTGNDRFDGGGGSDTFYTYNAFTGNVNGFAYLDGTADTNGNGIADYIDRGVTLTADGISYTGFATGRTGSTLLINFENLLGNDGNDYLVGDNAANQLNGRAGNNTLFGMGGDDIIHAANGANTIDGGAGNDTVDFSNSWYASGTTQAAYVFLGDASFSAASDKAYYFGGNLPFQARTGTGTFSTIVNVENITGSSLSDVLYGDGNANIIRAGASDDIIAGNGGADSLYGEAGNDLFLTTAANVAGTTLFDGGAGTDTLQASGLNVTAGYLAANASKFTSLEVLDIRNGTNGGAYSVTALDIQGFADLGTSSNITIKIDSGDTVSITTGAGTGALSYLVASTTATDTIYYLYSDAGHSTLNATNRVGIIDVHIGA